MPGYVWIYDDGQCSQFASIMSRTVQYIAWDHSTS